MKQVNNCVGVKNRKATGHSNKITYWEQQAVGPSTLSPVSISNFCRR